MSYLQPEQLTATAYADTALQLYLEQLQNHTADLVHVSPPNIDMSALATLQSTSAIANFQSDMASLDPCAAQDNSPACTYQDVSSQVEQAAQQQQETGRQASANGKQSAVWVQRNRKNQKTYRMKQKAQKQQMEEQIEQVVAHIEKLKVENNRIAGRNSTLETVLSFRGDEIATLQQQHQVMSNGGDLQPFIRYDSESQESKARQPLADSTDSVIQAYKANVDLMASLLLKLDQQGPSTQLAQQIMGACIKSAQISMRAAILSPGSIIKLTRVNLQSPQADTPIGPTDRERLKQHWQQVTDILQLRPEQQQAMIHLQKHFARGIADNRKKRRSICRGLHEHCKQGTETMKRYHAAVGTESQKYVATIFEVYAEVQRLRDNLCEQHRIWIDFYASVFKVWDHVQHCQAVVHGFPKYPDIVAMCSCAANTSQSTMSAQPQQQA